MGETLRWRGAVVQGRAGASWSRGREGEQLVAGSDLPEDPARDERIGDRCDAGVRRSGGSAGRRRRTSVRGARPRSGGGGKRCRQSGSLPGAEANTAGRRDRGAWTSAPVNRGRCNRAREGGARERPSAARGWNRGGDRLGSPQGSGRVALPEPRQRSRSYGEERPRRGAATVARAALAPWPRMLPIASAAPMRSEPPGSTRSCQPGRELEA